MTIELEENFSRQMVDERRSDWIKTIKNLDMTKNSSKLS